MANTDYNFQYTPLTGRLPGNSFVQQTEQAINELAEIVNEGAAQVEVITNLANTANDNSEEALEKATEALETSSRVYITLPNLDDADDYFDSQLYYFANSRSDNLPVEDTGFLEVKTNDTKTAAEQVFIADTTGLMYMRHGDITSTEVGDETVYSVTWETWSSALASEDYVQQEVNTGVNTANSYTDEQIRQHGNLPVGYEYFTFNPSIPQGSLPLFGGEYSRSTYSDLWAWVQTQTGYLKTEAQWQALSTANAGNVPYYSDGDGSTTFRVPSLKCWVRGANGTVTEVGSYLEAGLPNITGSFGQLGYINGDRYGISLKDSVADGAFSTFVTSPPNSNVYTPVSGSGVTTSKNGIKFQASDSNSVYSNSTTVQPESIVGLWLVKAYGVIVDTGTINEQQYIDDRFAAAKDYTDSEINSITQETIGTITALNGSLDDAKISLIKVGKFVECNFSLSGITGIVANTWTELIQLPNGFYPKVTFDFAAVNNANGTGMQADINSTTGKIRIWSQSTYTTVRGHVFYIVAD